MTGLVAMVKGFKVDVEVLDAFLDENGLWETFGTRPLPEQAEEITQLFKAKGVQGDVKVFVPHQIGYNNPNYMLVCFDWMLVYAIREFDSGSLQKNMPPGLKEIKTMLKADSNEVRTWVIFNDEEWPWTPELIVQRHTVRSEILA